MSIDSDADIGGHESFSVEATNWCLVSVAMWRPWHATSWAGLNFQHRFVDDVGWFVPLLNIQPIQWVSSKVRSLISWWFIGFKVHWALSWLQPTPPKKPQTLQTSHFFPWSSNTVNDAPLRREQCPESSMCKGKKKKEEHHMHSLPNKTMKRAHWKARSYFGREKKKKHAECGIQALLVCVWRLYDQTVCEWKRVWWPVTAPWLQSGALKSTRQGPGLNPRQTSVQYRRGSPQWETDCLFNYCFMEYLVTGSP